MSDLEEDVSANYVGTSLEIGREWVGALGSEVIVRAITSPSNNAPHKVYFSYQVRILLSRDIQGRILLSRDIGDFMKLFSPTPNNKAASEVSK
ncbi:hypothetical protein [Psychrobacter sp.]|uniref:hypothetical protein n=1 Tax=Psychrobacter sp. TaxID=56811 RepID=UPI003F985881